STSKTPSYTKSVSWQHHRFAIQGHYWREVSIEQLVADDIAM
ncbi:hypothetical protein, partial [Escherichia coli]